MNTELQAFARNSIIDGLNKLDEGWQRKFKLMYGRTNKNQTVDEILAAPIEKIVARMDSSKLDWAMDQVKNSLAKIANSL